MPIFENILALSPTSENIFNAAQKADIRTLQALSLKPNADVKGADRF